MGNRYYINKDEEEKSFACVQVANVVFILVNKSLDDEGHLMKRLTRNAIHKKDRKKERERERERERWQHLLKCA